MLALQGDTRGDARHNVTFTVLWVCVELVEAAASGSHLKAAAVVWVHHTTWNVITYRYNAKGTPSSVVRCEELGGDGGQPGPA